MAIHQTIAEVFKHMSKFLDLYNLIMEELIAEGFPSSNINVIDNLPNSKKLGLQNFKCTEHSGNRDFERLGTYEISDSKMYELIDKLCTEVLTHRRFQISESNRFCGLAHVDDNYFKIIIAFDDSKKATLITVISINKHKYEELLNEIGYISEKGFYNFIIKL